jgi:excisionase family DNA binding protein
MLENANQEYRPKRMDGERPLRVEDHVAFEPLLDTDEAAMLLRMHPRTLRTKARKGIIPAVQVGGRWRFRASTLNHWLEKMAS